MSMKRDFFRGHFTREGRRIARALSHCAQGRVACDGCGAQVDFPGLEPLSLHSCPACGQVVFIPWRVENWWVIRPLAAGGFGSVYLGVSAQDLKQKVAVKVLRKDEEVDPDALAGFDHECDIAFSLEPHPNLAETYATGSQDDRIFMVSRFVEGPNLKQRLDDGGAIPPEESLYYTLDVVGALRHLYRAGYMDRDVKPENVIIGPDYRAILVDYGNCLTIEEAKNSGVLPVFGSAVYMAPERYLKQGEDLRADIYSLGMLLYYILMGQDYFTAAEIRGVAKGHLRTLRVRTRDKMPNFDPALADLVDGMVARSREDRFQSYEDLVSSIVAVLGVYRQLPAVGKAAETRRRNP